ncbi:hypothetical protein CPC08DRAFT_724510 [Agrocybe pediades]|nr:hypothetical protein CPC08DRAFT_724510 [Agrocybe pediades]
MFWDKIAENENVEQPVDFATPSSRQSKKCLGEEVQENCAFKTVNKNWKSRQSLSYSERDRRQDKNLNWRRNPHRQGHTGCLRTTQIEKSTEERWAVLHVLSLRMAEDDEGKKSDSSILEQGRSRGYTGGKVRPQQGMDWLRASMQRQPT